MPATLSPKILTGLLRDMLHFNGLVVTDALEMGGITNRFWGGWRQCELFRRAPTFCFCLPMLQWLLTKWNAPSAAEIFLKAG